MYCIFQLLQNLLWESNLRNIMSGLDDLSPLIQPLPRVYAQDDPELIEIIRRKYLIPPSPGSHTFDSQLSLIKV